MTYFAAVVVGGAKNFACGAGALPSFSEHAGPRGPWLEPSIVFIDYIFGVPRELLVMVIFSPV